MKIDIEIEQEFTHDGITYTCVGHEEGLVWGVSNEFEESRPFDCQNCTPISPFTISNESGLCRKFFIQKIDPEGNKKDVDENSEYFVLRLDENTSDINHLKACRIGVNAYANAIETTLPKLAKDLRERYPLL